MCLICGESGSIKYSLKNKAFTKVLEMYSLGILEPHMENEWYLVNKCDTWGPEQVVYLIYIIPLYLDNAYLLNYMIKSH